MSVSDPLKRNLKPVREQGRRMNRINDDPTQQPSDGQKQHVRSSSSEDPAHDPPESASATNEVSESARTEAATKKDPTSSDDEFRQLVQLANKGDEEAIAALGKVLDDNPDVWRKAGDLAGHVRTTLIRLIAGDNALLRDSLVRKAEELLSDLSGEEPSPLDRLAVERVVSCWFSCSEGFWRAVESWYWRQVAVRITGDCL